MNARFTPMTAEPPTEVLAPRAAPTKDAMAEQSPRSCCESVR